ncbi:hypothetical protein BDW59DRAFT_5584 [Aspergillus cavernicola]|uniref:Uncharacterized protein n=1 Tax=Aspergillus cavernicola TaxID=176166 RepID=A0ABR4J632_9EURO
MPSLNNNPFPPPPPPNPPAHAPTWPDLTPVEARTAKCDICNRRNQGNMRRCVRCGWQTCHGSCVEDPRCSYRYSGRKCTHFCPGELHRGHNTDKICASGSNQARRGVQQQARRNGGGKRGRSSSNAAAAAVGEATQQSRSSMSVRVDRCAQRCVSRSSSSSSSSSTVPAPIPSLSHGPSLENTPEQPTSNSATLFLDSPSLGDKEIPEEDLHAAWILVSFSQNACEKELQGDTVNPDASNRQRERRRSIRRGKRPQYSELTDEEGEQEYHDDDRNV